MAPSALPWPPGATRRLARLQERRLVGGCVLVRHRAPATLILATDSTTRDVRDLGPDDELEELGPGHEPNRSYPPFFSPIEAAGSYVGAATVLAGFCFTAVVLIVTLEQSRPGDFDRAVVALLTAFLGLVLSGFLQAVVAGQMRRSRRTFWLALLAGVSLASSALFALWGVCEIINVVFSRPAGGRQGEDLVELVSWVFVIGSIAITAFVANVGVNLRRLAEADPRDEWVRLVIAQLVFVFVAELALRYAIDVTDQTPINRIAIIQLVAVAVVIISTLVLASFSGLLLTNADSNWRRMITRLREATPLWLRRYAPRPGVVTMLFTCVLVALPPALAWVLLARLQSQPFV